MEQCVSGGGHKNCAKLALKLRSIFEISYVVSLSSAQATNIFLLIIAWCLGFVKPKHLIGDDSASETAIVTQSRSAPMFARKGSMFGNMVAELSALQTEDAARWSALHKNQPQMSPSGYLLKRRLGHLGFELDPTGLFDKTFAPSNAAFLILDTNWVLMHPQFHNALRRNWDKAALAFKALTGEDFLIARKQFLDAHQMRVDFAKEWLRKGLEDGTLTYYTDPKANKLTVLAANREWSSVTHRAELTGDYRELDLFEKDWCKLALP